MAITKNLDGDVLGAYSHGLSFTSGSIAGVASYATGGFAADIETDLGITEANIVGQVVVSSDAGYTGSFDAANNKILAYASGGTEVTASANLSAVTFGLLVPHKAG